MRYDVEVMSKNFDGDVLASVSYHFGSRRRSSSNNAKILIIKTKERNLCLAAQNSDDCDRWYRAIQMQLDLREGGTVSGPRGTRNRRQSNGGGDKYKVRSEGAD